MCVLMLLILEKVFAALLVVVLASDARFVWSFSFG